MKKLTECQFCRFYSKTNKTEDFKISLPFFYFCAFSLKMIFNRKQSIHADYQYSNKKNTRHIVSCFLVVVFRTTNVARVAGFEPAG